VTSNVNRRSLAVIDGACVRSAAAYANDAVGSDILRRPKGLYNAEIEDVLVSEIPLEQRHGATEGYLVGLVATKRISGTVTAPVEIVTSYGRGYWEHVDNYTSTTQKKKLADAMNISAESILSPPHSILLSDDDGEVESDGEGIGDDVGSHDDDDGDEESDSDVSVEVGDYGSSDYGSEYGSEEPSE
jgi:hypothetical protein